jgi:hypothetical protein
LDHLKTLEEKWNTFVSRNTKAYGYEVYIRISRIFLDKEKHVDEYNIDDNSPLINAIAAEVHDSGGAGHELFVKLWNKYRQELLA